MVEMENVESQPVVVVLTANEVEFVRECVLNCPVQTNVTNMVSLLNLVQGILKKLAPAPAPAGAPPTAEGVQPDAPTAPGRDRDRPTEIPQDRRERLHRRKGGV